MTGYYYKLGIGLIATISLNIQEIQPQTEKQVFQI